MDLRLRAHGIIFETLGEKRGRRYEPILMTMFFLILWMNITGIIPGLQLAGTSAIGLPIMLAIVAWVMFIYAGMREKGGRFWKDSLFLPGVPWPLYFLLTPLEFFSTFILRPITLTLRLTMNMIAGHMLLVLCFSATQFFFFTVLADGNLLGLLGVGLRLRRRLHRARALRRRSAGIRLHDPVRHLHPARGRRRALIAPRPPSSQPPSKGTTP